MQNDAEIVPAGRQAGVLRHRAARGLFRFAQPPVLPTHFGEIAVEQRPRARRPASLHEIIDGASAVLLRMRDQTQQMQRVGITGTRRQNLVANPLRAIGVIGPCLLGK